MVPEGTKASNGKTCSNDRGEGCRCYERNVESDDTMQFDASVDIKSQWVILKYKLFPPPKYFNISDQIKMKILFWDY